jgi:hypothetical protein
MNITYKSWGGNSEKSSEWHVLTVAEDGFSMLTIYSQHHNLDNRTIRSFADRVNFQDMSGSLYPDAPISALPRRFFREQAENMDPNILNEFQQHVIEFLTVNESTINAQKILIDFHVSPAPVPERYTQATVELLHKLNQSLIQEVIIIK